MQLVILGLCIALSVTAVVGVAGDGLVVRTQQGNVVGTLVSSTVRQFLGIPYAAASRWEAPRPPPVRNTTFEAVGFGDSCVQNLSPLNMEVLKLVGLSDDNIIVPEADDCLNVNIWTPGLNRKQKTAVMIWIYGGGFQFGTSNLVFYDGQNMVQENEDILFPNQSQNFGLLDVEAAVKWVHENIAEFGGDPDHIILCGQSAGGMAADAYSYAHPHDTIVKGIIAQSGTLSNNNGDGTVDPSGWNRVANVVGCGTATTDTQLSCMKAVPFRKLEDAVISTNSLFPLLADSKSFTDVLHSLNPPVDPTDITFFSDILARSAAGNFLRVPLLIGSTENEADIFTIAFEETTLGFTVPILTELASDVATKATIFPGSISTWQDLRSYHTSEIPIAFGTYKQSFNSPPTNDEIAFSRYVQRAWVAFARDPTYGLSNYGWPTYDPNTASLVQLGNAVNRTGATFSQVQLTDSGCDALDALEALSAQLQALLTGKSSSKPV